MLFHQEEGTTTLEDMISDADSFEWFLEKR